MYYADSGVVRLWWGSRLRMDEGSRGTEGGIDGSSEEEDVELEGQEEGPGQEEYCGQEEVVRSRVVQSSGSLCRACHRFGAIKLM